MDGFVYAAPKRGIPKLARDFNLEFFQDPNSSDDFDNSDLHKINICVRDSLPLEVQLMPSLPATGRFLLYHFAHEASRITSCHVNTQKELCQLVISMAIEMPCLMYATLAWAAIHCVASNRRINGATDPARMVAFFKAKSIESLRRELQNPNGLKGENADALLATVRTLCQCEIHSGTDGSSVWRVHVKGAKALMTAIKRGNTSWSSRSRLLCRWYASLESLAALTPTNSLSHSAEASQSMLHTNLSNILSDSSERPSRPSIAHASACRERYTLADVISESVYLDDYNGYSTDLSFVLGSIGAAAESMNQNHTPLDNDHVQDQANELEEAVRIVMERDNNNIPVFYPGVAEKLSQQDISQYTLCNQAYQHTALIHIQRRLRSHNSNTPAIQESVKSIIKCASALTPTYGLSPAIVLTTPLFTAGCEALGEDRESIRSLLEKLFDMLRIRNIRVAIEILESHWAGGSGSDWELFLSMSHSQVLQ